MVTTIVVTFKNKKRQELVSTRPLSAQIMKETMKRLFGKR